MSLIDTSYFILELDIANSDRPEFQELIEGFILQYEDELLEDVLGYPLLKAFKAAPTEARMQDLIKGKEYTDLSSRLRKYKGLINEGNDPYKFSPLAGYVYFYFMRNQIANTVSVGEIGTNTDNAGRVATQSQTLVRSRFVNQIKLQKAWNTMSSGVYGLMDFLYSNQPAYPEWDVAQMAGLMQKYKPLNPYNL